MKLNLVLSFGSFVLNVFAVDHDTLLFYTFLLDPCDFLLSSQFALGACCLEFS